MHVTGPFRRWGGVTVSCCVLGAVLAAFGVADFLKPHAQTIRRPRTPAPKVFLMPRSGPERQSERQVRWTGVIMVAFGALLAGGGITVRRRKPTRHELDRARRKAAREGL